MATGSYLSIITLNVNGLNAQGKEVVDLRLKSTSVSAKAHAVYDVTLSFPHELCGRS